MNKVLEKEMANYFSQLNEIEKRSVIQMLKALELLINFFKKATTPKKVCIFVWKHKGIK